MSRFRQIEDGVLLGAQPTEEELKNLKQQGFHTVIDCRLPGETAAPNEAMARRCGLDYANIPVNKARLAAGQVDELERVMQQKQGPFLIHCASGARAAALLSLAKAKEHHWDAERAFEEARAMGFDLKSSPDFAAFVTAVTQGKL